MDEEKKCALRRVHCWTREYLFWLCAIWTVTQMALIAFELFKHKPYNLPPMMPIYYAVLLTVYVVVKEAARWAHKAIGRKRGEYFFVAWWLYALVLFGLSARSGGSLEVPSATLTNCWFVSMVYAAGSLSKLLHRFRLVQIRLRIKERANHGKAHHG